MNGILEAWFRRVERGRWGIALRVNDVARGDIERDADVPPKDLLEWIIAHNPDDLLEGTWNLRIRANDLTPPAGPLPPVLCWPRLLDSHGTNVLTRGWTLLHQTAELRGDPEKHAWKLTGRVAVLGDQNLKERLDALHVAYVLYARDVGNVPDGAIVVVPGNFDARALVALQSAFTTKECPLVVWCGAVVPPESTKLLEVVPTGEGHPATEALEHWLARLLPQLQAGEAPERALARSLRDGPEGALEAWMLRGVPRRWHLPEATRDWREKLLHWRREIDRNAQTGFLKTFADDLLTAGQRRVHVTVVGGPHNAGLHYFRARPLDPRPSGLAVHTVYREPPWASVTAETLDALCQTTFGVAGVSALAVRLRRMCTRGQVLFVRLNQPVITLGDGTADTVTFDGLRGWFASLATLADLLDDSVRVFVNVYVVTADPQSLDDLQMECGPRVTVSTLPALDATVPYKEIDAFLLGKEIEPDPKARMELVKELACLDYDGMIDRLMRQYARKLLPP